MSTHESSINFQNLIQNLADMYPFDVSEVIITELIANALDAKATQIKINYDHGKKVLVVEDNGLGMTKGQFDEYHDFAAGLKHRGTGIGFAGLGAKISFNIASQVITETQSSNYKAGSNWYLQANKKLIWEDTESIKINHRGTRVEVHFNKECKTTYKESKDIVHLVQRHYLPLLDKHFLNLYEDLGHYSRELRFIVNGEVINPFNLEEKFQLEKIGEFKPEKKNKLIGCGIFGLAKEEYPIENGKWGVWLCTYGKVIKNEDFSQNPGTYAHRIFGIVEIPEFINFITAQKTDFTKKGQFKKFENLMSPVRQKFVEWLRDKIGIQQQVLEGDDSVKLEKEIRKIMNEVPEIAKFFGFWSKNKILTESRKGNINADYQEGRDTSFPNGSGNKGHESGFPDIGSLPGLTLQEKEEGEAKAQPISRSSKIGPKIGFERNNNDRDELAWIEGNQVIINHFHPIYEKAKLYKKDFLIDLFAIACAIHRFKGLDESEVPDFLFIDKMMKALGEN